MQAGMQQGEDFAKAPQHHSGLPLDLASLSEGKAVPQSLPQRSFDQKPETSLRMNIASPIITADHTMQETVSEYVRMKVPDEVINTSWLSIIVKGSYTRAPQARISHTEKRDKPFNWQRPTTTVTDEGTTLQINCFPGRDYVHHYAVIVATYLSLFRRDFTPVLYTYPAPSQSSLIFQRSNLAEMGPVDVVVVGYVNHLNRFVGGSWQFGTNRDNLFAWQRLRKPQGREIAFLGCMISFWGEMSGHLVRALQELNKVKCVLYVGKAGALRAAHAPNEWIATGNESFVEDRVVTWNNVLAPDIEGSSLIAEGAHVTIPTPLLETKEWFKKWENSACWVDCEVGHIAEACNHEGISFGFLHIVSDNLARDFPHNLVNERREDVKRRRKRLFQEAQTVLTLFFSRWPLEDESIEGTGASYLISAKSSSPSRSSNDYTVACICRMGVELAPVEAMLDEIHPSLPTLHDQKLYTLGRIQGHNIVVAAMPEIVNNSAAAVATQLLNDFPAVRFSLLVGVGGGIPGCNEEEDDDVRLGDIVVSKSSGTFGGVVQYKLGKVTAGGFFERIGMLSQPPPILTASVMKLKAQHLRDGSQVCKYLSDMIEKYPRMAQEYAHPGTTQDRLFRATYSHQGGQTCRNCDSKELVGRQERHNQEPHIHHGIIGSANTVINDSATREGLRRDMNIICVEMEAAGLMDTFPSLVIRGICDYADSHKNKQWQPYAAAVAAAYMKELLSTIPPAELMKA